MLTITRRANKREGVEIEGPAKVYVTAIRGKRAWLTIDAEKGVNIRRIELPRQPGEESEIDRLRMALNELVKLQSHYAALLNQFDGGSRIQLNTAEEWLARWEAARRGPIDHEAITAAVGTV